MNAAVTFFSSGTPSARSPSPGVKASIPPRASPAASRLACRSVSAVVALGLEEVAGVDDQRRIGLRAGPCRHGGPPREAAERLHGTVAGGVLPLQVRRVKEGDLPCRAAPGAARHPRHGSAKGAGPAVGDTAWSLRHPTSATISAAQARRARAFDARPTKTLRRRRYYLQPGPPAGDDPCQQSTTKTRPQIERETDLPDEEGVLADAVEVGPSEPADADALDADEVVPPASAGALTPLRDPVGRFLAEARRFPRLTDEEERKLGKAVRERGT